MANVKISGLPTASTPFTGAELVPVVQSGVTSQTTVSNIVLANKQLTSVFNYMTSAQIADVQAGTLLLDVTAACQAALDANEAVYFPEGSYRIDTELNISSNTTIIGAGPDATMLYQFMQSTGTYPSTGVETGTSPNASNKRQYGIIHANSQPAPYYPAPATISYVTNITIRDISFNGQTEQSSVFKFNYYTHLLSLNGVKDVLIDNCHFIGYRCDGVFLGAEWFAEKHNVNVTIQNCVFDGVNYYNRNGISVIDGNGISILNNTFRNTSQPDMPGPIDVEPDAFSWHIVKDINIIGNRIESHGGTGGIQIGTMSAPTMATMTGINIQNNYIEGNTLNNAYGIVVRTGETPISSSTTPMGITIKDNTTVCTQALKITPILVRNVRGVTIDNNTFNGGTVAEIGYFNSVATSAKDIIVSNNKFYKNGNVYGSLLISSVDDLMIDNNVFQEPNYGTSARGIAFYGDTVTTASNRVKVINNTYIKGASQTISNYVNLHTLNTATNYYYGNRVVGGTLTNQFTYNYGGAQLYYSGTFTPAIYDTGGGLTITQTSTGNYVRVGNLMYVTLSCQISGLSGVASGRVSIAGLPATGYSAYGTQSLPLSFYSYVDIPAGYTQVNGILDNNAATIKLRAVGDNTGEQHLFATQIASNTLVVFSFCYTVNNDKSSIITLTIASPGVVTWNSHGLVDGQPIVFSTTGALPTGITAGTTYYVVNSTTNTFQISATVGGAAINTSGVQSGLQTCTATIYP